MTETPSTPLETEAAIQLGLLIQQAGYHLEVTPRTNGADLAASRDGTVWVTFHVDVDPKRPLFLRVGATVWGGARVPAGFDVAWDAAPDDRLVQFARERIQLACRRGREQNPDHCADCPVPGHRRT